MFPLLGMNLIQHPPEEALEAYVMRTLPASDIGLLETHLAFCLLCLERVSEARDFVTTFRAAAVECLKSEEPRDARSHWFTHDTDDGVIVSEVTRLGPTKWFAHHWGPQMDGGMTTRTLMEAVTYLTQSFQQMFPEHVVCTTRCQRQSQRPKSNRA